MVTRPLVLILVPAATDPVEAEWRQKQAGLLATVAGTERRAPIAATDLRVGGEAVAMDVAESIGKLVGRDSGSQVWACVSEDGELGKGVALSAYRGWRVGKGLQPVTPREGQEGLRIGKWEAWRTACRRAGMEPQWEALAAPTPGESEGRL